MNLPAILSFFRAKIRGYNALAAVVVLAVLVLALRATDWRERLGFILVFIVILVIAAWKARWGSDESGVLVYYKTPDTELFVDNLPQAVVRETVTTAFRELAALRGSALPLRSHGRIREGSPALEANLIEEPPITGEGEEAGQGGSTDSPSGIP